MWGEEQRPALLPKTKGSGVMVLDFVEEHDSYLRLSDDQYERDKVIDPSIAQSARVTFEYGIEGGGYWTGERFLTQMKIACDIAQFIQIPTSLPHSRLHP